MKKISHIVVGLLLVSSSVMAVETKWYIGADASYANLDAKIGFTGTATIDGVDYSNLSAGIDDKDTALGLKVGAILNEKHRISLNYTAYSPSMEGIKVDIDVATLNYDYMFDKVKKFTPFIGLHVGQAEVETLGYDDSSVAYGVQGGLIYSVTDNVEVEFGISYTTTDAKPTTPSISGTYDSVVLTNASAYLEFDDITRAYIGFNYKF